MLCLVNCCLPVCLLVFFILVQATVSLFSTYDYKKDVVWLPKKQHSTKEFEWPFGVFCLFLTTCNMMGATSGVGYANFSTALEITQGISGVLLNLKFSMKWFWTWLPFCRLSFWAMSGSHRLKKFLMSSSNLPPIC